MIEHPDGCHKLDPTIGLHCGKDILYFNTKVLCTTESNRGKHPMSDQVGSKWWKIDFHVHTPASRDYKEDGVTAKDWLRAAMEQELDAVVVADHNSGDWIDELKSAYAAMKQENASGFRELTIFPGFELSVNGGNRRFHLLGIFDPSTSRDGIHAVLAKCNISADDYGSVHVSSELGFVQAAKKSVRWVVSLFQRMRIVLVETGFLLVVTRSQRICVLRLRNLTQLNSAKCPIIRIMN